MPNEGEESKAAATDVNGAGSSNIEVASSVTDSRMAVSENKRDKNEAEEKKTDKDNEKDNKKEEKANDVVPFHKLFAFADSLDILLMIVGTVGSLGNGISMPLMTILFGDLINAFGQNTTDTHALVEKVNKVNFPPFT